MNEDNAIPPPCDKEIFNNGTLVMMTHSIPSRRLEEWVQQVACLSGQPVDWHFAGGRARILALGDLKKVREAILDLIQDHNARQRKEVMDLREHNGNTYPDFVPSYTLYGDGDE